MPFPYKYFPLYAADFDIATRLMSVEAVGAYIRLLISQWINGSIPDNLDQLARIAGTSDLKRFKESVWPEIEMKFPIAKRGERRNARLEVEREKSMRTSEKKSRAATIRWKDRNRSGELDAPASKDLSQSESESESESLLRPPPSEEEPAKRKRPTRIPEDWKIDDGLREWAAEKIPGLDIDAETETFVDWWIAEGRTKVDWRRTWMVWMRKQFREQGTIGGGRRERSSGGTADIIERATGVKRI